MAELWDLYDKDKNKLNKVVKRGDKLKEDEYHLVVNAWIKNDKGEFLISRRSKNKPHPLMWESTGGSCLFGEDSLQGAIREVKEELGIDINKKDSKYIGRTLRYYKDCNDILEAWLFKSNAPIDEIHIQKEEVEDVMWASIEKIKELNNNNQFLSTEFLNEILEKGL